VETIFYPEGIIMANLNYAAGAPACGLLSGAHFLSGCPGVATYIWHFMKVGVR
jgi:hypothetical protein